MTAKNILIIQILLLIILTMPFPQNVLASKQDRQVKNFNKIEISGGFNVILTQGTVEKLTIDADVDIHPKIITEVRGGTLIIKLENNMWNKNIKNLTAELTFIHLDGIDVSGAVKITGTNPMKFSDLKIDGSGATKINLNLSATRLSCDFSGASEITLKGNAPEFEVDLSGASNLEALNFLTRKCSIECSGASNAKVYATESLKVEGSGASEISYSGNPADVDTDLSGASKIKKN